ncbi:unnamed protein product [Cylicocyclus nassatus]|uniref:Hint domain-containing protein n=1 Tax=Cylicocyclus nassatus TaxID=53992 RepID=A0AA36M2W9_CYLNA|nr:unnamed protein product [Cylicocyclus nassatus]
MATKDPRCKPHRRDWNAIETEYIQGYLDETGRHLFPTKADIQNKYNITMQVITKRAKEKSWDRRREEFQAELQKKTAERLMAEIANGGKGLNLNLYKMAADTVSRCHSLLPYAGTGQEIRNLIGAAKDAQAIASGILPTKTPEADIMQINVRGDIMSQIDISIDPAIINNVYLSHVDDEHRYQIFYGGSSSGKSYFLAQRLVIDMLRGGHNYLCCRKVARTVRKSLWNEIQKALSFFNVSHLFKSNASELVITGPNGWQILFVGLDDVEKVKSISPAKGVITDIWVEEATEAEYSDIKQLDKRLRGQSVVKKRLILSFNPIYQQHWLYQQYFAGHWADDSTRYADDTLSILKTTYKDNGFLMEDDIHALESESDPYWYSVYALGNWGILGHAIFHNWTTSDLSDTEFDSYVYGLDWGFSNDPTAIVQLHYERRTHTLYIKLAEYLHGYTNDLIAAEVKKLNPDLIICDSSEPKSIAELKRHGLCAIPATKGPDSVMYGIKWLSKQRIVIDASLRDAIAEFTTYKWLQDKDGKALPKPEDKNNHCLTGDTLVHTTNGILPIRELVGTTGKVYCYNEEKKCMTTSKYRDCRLTQKEAPILQIELEDGRVLKATAEHPVYTQRGWVTVGELTENDSILKLESINTQLLRVTEIKPAGVEDVFNLEVDCYHNFCVNGGLVVHNCIDAIRYACQYLMTEPDEPDQTLNQVSWPKAGAL